MGAATGAGVTASVVTGVDVTVGVGVAATAVGVKIGVTVMPAVGIAVVMGTIGVMVAVSVAAGAVTVKRSGAVVVTTAPLSSSCWTMISWVPSSARGSVANQLPVASVVVVKAITPSMAMRKIASGWPVPVRMSVFVISPLSKAKLRTTGATNVAATAGAEGGAGVGVEISNATALTGAVTGRTEPSLITT